MKKSLVYVGLVGLMLSATACSKKEEVKETFTQTTQETVADGEDYSINESIGLDKNDLRVVEYGDNDSGVKNPQSNFKDKFAPVNEDVENPYMTPSGMPNSLDTMKEAMGDDFDIMMEYEANRSVLTEDLIRRMHEKGIDEDTDEDGLLDYDEIEVYHTDPNKKSTSGDIYSDGYKVENGMTLNKKYDTEWVELDEKVSVLPADSESFTSRGYELYEDYLDKEGSYNFRVAMYFEGDVKVDVQSLGLSDPVVEVFNEYDYTHKEINTEKVEDGVLQFHIDKGYNVYLIHEKSVDIEAALQEILGD